MASVLSVMVVLVSLLAASSNLLQIYRSIQKRLITTERMEEVNQDVDQLNAQISSYKVSPDLVRKAVALAAKELDSVATIQPLLLALTNAMATDPNLRLREFQWRLLEAGTDACLSTMSAASAGGDAKQPGSEARRVELSFQLELPGTYGPRDRAAALRAFAAAIASIDRITVLRDAYREQASGTLRGGSIVSAAGEMTWCVTVPGDTSSDGADAGAPKT